MKHKIIPIALIAACTFGTLDAAAQTPAYHANLLGISDGRTNIQVEHPIRLNRWGQVVGTFGGGLSGGTHAVLWTPNSANDGNGTGTLFSLELSQGLPPGTANSWPTGLNDRGQITGGAYTPGHGDGNQNQSWMWRPSPLNSPNGRTLNTGVGKAETYPLVSIPGLGSSSENNQVINNNGSIAAYGIYYHALLWVPDQNNGFVSSAGWTYEPVYCSGPSGINDAGQISGSICESPSENVPYLHSGALPLVDTDLITSPLWLQPPTQNGIGGSSGLNQGGDLAVTAVNNAGTLVGAYLYKSGTAVDLSPGMESQANAINDSDQVVGHADTDTRRAYLFENGTATDLNTLNDSIGGLLLKDAIAINNAGQILCNGLYPGAGASILLTPNAMWIQPVSVSKGPLKHQGATYKQAIRVTNTGTSTMPGSISVGLDGLTAGVTLTNVAGTTAYAGPIGSAYVTVSTSDLAPGATTAAFTLVFSNPSQGAINYSARVLVGTAPR